MPSKAGLQTARPGRPPRLSRDAIAAAALAVGLDKVTVAAVARRLGTDHSSLYRHVRDRRDMIVAAADLAIGALRQPSRTTDWRVLVERAAAAVWTLYETHPGLANVIRELDATPPAGVRAFSATVARLEALGFRRDDAVLILDSVMDMTIDCAIGWARLRGSPPGDRGAGDSMLQSWVEVSGETPALAAQIEGMARVIAGSPRRWWRRKLDLILDGAEALLARRQDAGPPARQRR